MADEVSARDAKVIQWLNEAYGKEKQLETALQAHIRLTDNAPHKKRLQQHLKETKDHARQVERRIKKLGGTAEAVDLPGPDALGEGLTAVASVAGRAVASAQGAVQGMRGTSPQERQLKNAKDELHEEAEEIANYTAIIELADQVGDKETSKMAKGILREEQRMFDFVAKQIPKLTREVVRAEIPKEERSSSSSSSSRSRSSSSRRSSSSSSRSRGSSSRSSSSNGSSGSSARSSARKAASTAGKTAKTAAKSGSTAARKTASTARSQGKTAAKRTASTARKSSSGSSTKASSGGSRSSNSGSSKSSGSSSRSSSSRSSSSSRKKS